MCVLHTAYIHSHTSFIHSCTPAVHRQKPGTQVPPTQLRARSAPYVRRMYILRTSTKPNRNPAAPVLERGIVPTHAHRISTGRRLRTHTGGGGLCNLLNRTEKVQTKNTAARHTRVCDGCLLAAVLAEPAGKHMQTQPVAALGAALSVSQIRKPVSVSVSQLLGQ